MKLYTIAKIAKILKIPESTARDDNEDLDLLNKIHDY